MRKRVPKFAVVGLLATAIYAAVAFWLSRVMTPVQASVTAYGVAAVFSYCGHKFVTFASDGAHAAEAPRFAILTLTGVAIAWALPLVLSDGFGLSPFFPIAATCLLIPAFNYVVLERWVFRDAR